MLTFIKLNFVKLSVIMLRATMLNVAMLSVAMLIVVNLSVVWVYVVAPFFWSFKFFFTLTLVVTHTYQSNELESALNEAISLCTCCKLGRLT